MAYAEVLPKDKDISELKNVNEEVSLYTPVPIVINDNDIYSTDINNAASIRLIFISFLGFLNSSANGHNISKPENAKNITENNEKTEFVP